MNAHVSRLAPLAAALGWLLCTPAHAGEMRDKLTDPQDGWLDASAFLDTAYGFVPVVAPITEPAVGYGAVGALVFVDRKPPEPGQGFVRPNIATVGGLATENGTDGLFAAHLGTWRGGKLRTTLAVADADVNLSYYGLGESASSGGIDYAIAATGGVAGVGYRFGQGPLWIGLRYAYADTRVTLKGTDPSASLEIPIGDRSLRLAGLTPSLTIDTRDNFFTPTRGAYLDFSATAYRAGLGGDRDFELATLTGIYFHPLGNALYFGIRGTGKTSSDGTPFFMRPFITLRGVPAMRYQGEQTVEAEAELRWQFHPRFSLVGFGGAGRARSDVAGRQRSDTIGAGGLGIRYLLARQHGLHMGLDLAAGPDDPAIYVVFGSPWLRP